MDYKREAIEYLRQYDNLQTSLDNLKDEIRELSIDIKTLKAVSYSDMPSGRGAVEPDDALVNKMIRLSRAKNEYKRTQRTLDRIIVTMDRFEKDNSNYAKILKKYYMECLTEEQIAEDINMSQRHLRRLKNKAIKTFALSIFGVNVI